MSTASQTTIYFPPCSKADDDGLLMVGGKLTTSWLLAAYRQGIFPWPFVDHGIEILAWFSPDPRAIIELDALHVSRRLGRRIRRHEFSATCNQQFARVLEGCACRQQRDGTWLTSSMIDAYLRLHEAGFAHSVEVWQDQQLVGGIYGVALGGFFSGESMFHRRRDASKVALVYLVEHLKRRGFCLFDIQQWSPHSGSMGAIEISRREYLNRLEAALSAPVTFGRTLESADIAQAY